MITTGLITACILLIIAVLMQNSKGGLQNQTLKSIVGVNTAPDARLSPISATRFVYDDSGRFMDFNIDKDGKVLGVSVTRWDGTNYFEKIK